MFEDETVDIECPKCGHWNAMLVRGFEENAETHFVCVNCKTGVKVEADEFRHRLDQVRKELEELERDAEQKAKPKPKRPGKDDFQI
jgi:DNA-directed RNA polymerase subunit RPC12/RpoP